MTNATIPEDLAILLNPTHQWPAYEDYRPLSRGQAEIRLLYIHVDNVSKHLHAHIYHANLNDEHVEYEAISYCWGPPSTQLPLFVDTHPVLIRASLHNFLTTLCNKPGGQSLPIWVDSICINQRDVEERNHQVALMGRIYSNASQVLVWLGEFTPDSDYLFLFLQYYQDSRLQNCENRSWLEHSTRQGIDDIAQRPYWQRLWIVQELVLAKRIQLCSGSRFIKWHDLSQGLKYLFNILGSDTTRSIEENPSDQLENSLVQLTKFMRRVRGLPASSTEAHIQGQDTTSTVFDRIVQFSTQKCHDPRDRVYGLVSLASDASHLDIDYSKTMLEIAFDVVMLTWAPPACTSLYLDNPSMKRLYKLVKDTFRILNCRADMAMRKIDPSLTTHLRFRPLRQHYVETGSMRYEQFLNSPLADQYFFVTKFSHLLIDSRLRLRTKGYEYYNSVWQRAQEVWMCFYPHESTGWPCDDDWALTCKWLDERMKTTFVFRQTSPPKRRMKFIGIIQSKFQDSTRSMAELIAENEHFHPMLVDEASSLTDDHFGSSELSLEVSKLLLFQISLINISPQSSFVFLEDQRSAQWSECAQLRLPVLCNADGTAQWEVYNHISTSRQHARYQLRDICDHVLDTIRYWTHGNRQSVNEQDLRKLDQSINAVVLEKFQKVFKFTGELMLNNWYSTDVVHTLVSKIVGIKKSAVSLMDLQALSMELQDQVNMAALIVLDQFVFHIGMMRVADHEASSSEATEQNHHSDSRFEDFWMDMGLCLLSPLLCSVEDVSHAWLDQHDEEYLKLHADWAKQYADYQGNRFRGIRQHFKVWQHYDEIKATLMH